MQRRDMRLLILLPLSKAVMVDRAAGAKFVSNAAQLAAADITHLASSAVATIDREAGVVALSNGRMFARSNGPTESAVGPSTASAQ